MTNDTFTNAQPLYSQTYARIRWAVPASSRDKLMVLGGFIGGTEDGHTTTLGRGGSDLTASIVGAAIHADEIQVWKDVDGMLTCDPRLLRGSHHVKRLCYEEASELASAGATILHPETMEPARRLGIPIVIRNTFCPRNEGTRIDGAAPHCSTLVKSIAVNNDVTLLEVRSGDQMEDLDALVSFCKKHTEVASVLCSSEQVVYVALKENAIIPEESLAPDQCLQVRLRSHRAIVTLVGQSLNKEFIMKRLSAALRGLPTFIIPSGESPCAVRLAVPQEFLEKCLHLVHDAFFSDPDPRFFVANRRNAARTNYDSGAQSPHSPANARTFSFSGSLVNPN